MVQVVCQSCGNQQELSVFSMKCVDCGHGEVRHVGDDGDEVDELRMA